MTPRPIGFFSPLFVLTLCIISHAEAADVPSRETAGAEERRFTETREEKAASEGGTEPAVIEEEKKSAPAASDGALFKVSEIRLSGNYSIPDEELLPFAAPLLKGDTSLTAIRAAVEEMKKYYRSKGFPAAYVYVPAQQVQDGMLKIEVLEGRLGEVKVGQTEFFSEELVQSLFRLKPGDVLRYEPLRRDLARINRSPDLKAKAVLAPGAETGTTDIAVEAEEKYPIHFGGEINNNGTENTGEARYSLTAANDNLLGNLDRLTGTVQWGKGVRSLGAGYDFFVNPDWGTRAGYSYNYSEVDVGGSFAVLDVEGTARSHRVFLTQPLLEKEGLDIDGTLGFDSQSVENRLLGSVFGKDELRVPNAEIELRQSDAGGSTFMLNRVNWGISDFFGSSRKVDAEASRTGTGGQFAAYRGTLARFQTLPGDALLSIRGTAQFSPYALAPSQQISLGGARSVRGYREGEYLGDHGAFVSFDLYFPAFFFPEDWRLPHAPENLRKQVQMIAFADAGTAGLRRPLTGEKKDRDLAGTGLGFRVRFYDKFYGRFEYAFPIGDRALDGRDNAFYFTLSYDLF